jgi:hypothetical protein
VIHVPVAERLAAFRESTAHVREEVRRQAVEAWQLPRSSYRDRGLPLPIGGGAPTLQTTLAILRAPVTNNTFTTSRSIIGTTAGAVADCSGPFAVDWFNVAGASWEQEGMGVISTTGTPTISFQTTFGSAAGSVTTSLCTSATITTASALANVDWYYYVMGRTTVAAAASSTTIAFGYVQSQLATAAANNIINYVKNATPPTAVTTDWSAGQVWIDLRATWGTSSSSNTITTNFYRLSSLLS